MKLKRSLYRSLLLMVGFLLASSPVLPAPPESPAPKNVLILHSYHPELPWTQAIGDGMAAVLETAPETLNIHSEYMDTKRIFDPTHLEHLYTLFAHKYAHKKFDLILSSDDHAFTFINTHGDALFPGVPVVFCGVNNFDPKKIRSGGGVTGIVEAIDIKGTLAIARRLHPKARRIIGISDQTMTGQANRHLFEKALARTNLNPPVEIWDDVSMQTLKQRLAGIGDDHLLFWLHFTLDAEGKIFSFEESASQISAATQAPLYSFWDFHMGHGIVGGKLINGHAQGDAAARMALRILAGEVPESIPVSFSSPNRYMFDTQQLKRFNLSPAELPAGSILHNKPTGLASRVVKMLWAAGAVCAILVLVILALLINIHQRQLAEVSLATSRDRYQRIFHSAAVSLWEEDFSAAKEIIDRLREEGVQDFEAYFNSHPEVVEAVSHQIIIRDVNQRTLALYGAKDKQDLLGALDKIFTPETLPMMARQLVAMASGQRSFEEEGINRKLNGELLYVHLSMNLQEGERPFESVLVSVIDISDRKRSEQALQESESRFRGAFENVAAGTALISLVGRFNRVNPTLSRLLGVPADNLRDAPWESYLAAEDIASHREALDSLYAGRTNTLQLELRLCPPEGDRLWVLVTASLVRNADQTPSHLICQMQDIHQRKQTERDLRTSEERYRQFYDDDPSGVYIAEPDGRILTCNPAFMQIFGFRSTEHALVTNLVTLYPSADNRKAFLKKLIAEKRLENYAVEMQRLDGRPAHIRINAIGIFDGAGELTGIRGYLVDTTHQQNLEKQLLHAQKMEAVGTMAGGVAHDFNNLLMGILGNASLLRMDLPEDHPNQERLEIIETHVRSGSDLTRQLLGFAKGGKYEVVPTNLNRLIQDNARMFGRTRKEVRIETHFADALGTVEVDRSQMDQVFYNLYVNAWQAMGEGGRVTITTRNVTLTAADVRAHEIPPGDYVLISVADTGEGIPAENLPRVFDPFFTTKTLSRGTGLGLASVYGIIKNHQGMIDVESQKGRGTCFHIHLPMVAKKEDGQVASAATDTYLRGRETVLLVDDEPLVIQATEGMLTRLGYTLLTAESGQAALALFEAQHGRIDLVILDMIMPDMSGSDTFDGLQAIDPEVKVLLSSGYSRSGQAEEILERGGKGFIPKPFDMAAISHKIRELLDEAPA